MSFNNHAIISIERHDNEYGRTIVPCTTIIVGVEKKQKTVELPSEPLSKEEWEKTRLAADEFFYGGAFISNSRSP